MKRKIICLVLCIACLLTMLASCGGDGSVACDAHADLDKNSACDTCGIPVIVVTEKVPTEEAVVDMIVSEIPAGAKLGDVLVIKGEEQEFLPVFTKNETLTGHGDDGEICGKFAYFEYEEQIAGAETEEDASDDRFADVYVLYDIFAEKTVTTIKIEQNPEASNPDYVSVDTVTTGADLVFVVVKENHWVFNAEYGYGSYETVSTYYDVAGNKFASSADVEEGEYFSAPSVDGRYEDMFYVNYDGKKIILDVYTAEKIYECEEDLFVDRPYFDEVVGNYGFVEYGDRIYVYDLTKWIECVYKVEVSYDADVFYLNNGNILIQDFIALPDSAVNYDFAEGRKYDIVYTIVDVAAKTETEVEFGYYIDDVEMVDGDESYKDTVKNVIEATVIENQSLTDKDVVLFVDDSLKILGEYYAMLPEFVDEVEAVAEGVVLGTVFYGEGSSVRKLFDATGKEIATLPNSAVVCDGYIAMGGKFYNFKMEAIFDPNADAENPFTLNFEGNGYWIYTQGVDYFYWNPTLDAPVCIIDNPEPVEEAPAPEEGTEPAPASAETVEKTLLSASADYFVIKIEVTTEAPAAEEGGEPTEVTTTTYKAYNANNVEILSSEEAFNLANMYELVFGDEVRYIVEGVDKTVYIAK